jgi:hypothetical protein
MTTNDEDKGKNKIISLVPLSKNSNATEKDEELEGFILKGLDAFKESLGTNPQGFVTIVFGQDGEPSIIWAGDIDVIKSLGALKVAEHELLKTIDPYPSED